MSGRAITLPPYGTRGKARKDSGYTFWLIGQSWQHVLVEIDDSPRRHGITKVNTSPLISRSIFFGVAPS